MASVRFLSASLLLGVGMKREAGEIRLPETLPFSINLRAILLQKSCERDTRIKGIAVIGNRSLKI